MTTPGEEDAKLGWVAPKENPLAGIGVTPTDDWNGLYWAYNLPLQMWPVGKELPDGDSEKGHRVVNYMPRREQCKSMECIVTPTELPQFCTNTAAVLRNLANLFEALGEGKIKTIYYPDKTVEEEIADELQEAIDDAEEENEESNDI